jgi:dTDP-4-amino-4,6-dideoxygalactose transaminase
MSIPMLDLKAEYALFRDELLRRLAETLESTQYILGPNVQALEREVAAHVGVHQAVGCASGTDALHLALRALGIGPGDEVITSPFTFIGTSEAISYTGATPVFVDIQADTFNIDPAQIEQAITPRTKAVMPVHLYGQAADLDPIVEICRRHDLRLIEDCAQSYGARYRSRMTGSFGDFGCFSFYPSKNLGAFGDGGMVTTDEEALAAEVRVYRNHGSRTRYHHHVIGYNSRLDELQAVILRVKLQYLEDFNSRRRIVAHAYDERLAGIVVTPIEAPDRRHVYHQYTVRSPRRDAIQKALTEAGIGSMIYYPVPLHRQEVYADLCEGLTLPVSEAVAKEVISLPIFPQMTLDQVDQVCDVVRAAAKD